MIHKKLLLASLALCSSCIAAHADVTDGLVAYYNMNSLANQAAAVGSNTNVVSLNLTTGGTGASVGFTGNAAFNSDASAGTSNRSTLLVGNAANFSTASGFLSTAYTSTQLLNGGTAFSIGMWTYLAMDPDAASRRVYSYEAKDNYDISLGTSAGVTSATSSITQLSYFNQNTGYSTVGTQGSWQYVVQSYSDNGNNTYQVITYVNGVATDTRAISSNNGVAAGDTFGFNGINIGNNRGTSGLVRGWDGMIDEVVLYSRAIDQSDVTTLYNLGLTGTAVPEPSTYGLLGAGALASVAFVRRRRLAK